MINWGLVNQILWLVTILLKIGIGVTILSVILAILYLFVLVVWGE